MHVIERMRAALKYGLIIKPSGKMQWIANVVKLATYPSQMRDFNLYPLDADSAIEAARVAAEQCAIALYGDPFVSRVDVQADGDNLFMACVGEWRKGVNRGCSLSILVRKYEGR